MGGGCLGGVDHGHEGQMEHCTGVNEVKQCQKLCDRRSNATHASLSCPKMSVDSLTTASHNNDDGLVDT